MADASSETPERTNRQSSANPKRKKDQTPTLRPYDRRPWPTYGDADKDTTFAAVDRALTHWEVYEGALCLLFCELADPHDKNPKLPLRRAYSSVRTFEARQEMLRSVGEAHFSINPNAELEGKFKEVLKDAKEYGPRRNDIAHWQVGQHHDKDAVEWYPVMEPKLGYSLMPPFANTQHKDLFERPLYSLSSIEIDYWTGEFLKINETATQLFAEFAHKKWLQLLQQCAEQQA